MLRILAHMTGHTTTSESSGLGGRGILAEARVPRYTSYPTAAQFGALDEASFRAWLAAGIAPGDPLSLYLHVPFCRALCWYCGCHTRPTRSVERIRAYERALLDEMALLASSLPAHAGVSHLHLGGGTPSILGPEGLRRVIGAARGLFDIRPEAEIAIELDPRLMDASLVNTLAVLGVNRASLGVQDISPEIQAGIGRLQPAELIEIGVQRLRRAGIASINVDLIYGLPRQTVAHVEASARFAAGLDVSRIAAFGYAHVAWMRPHQKAIDEAWLPDAQERFAQAHAIEALLVARGYQAVGLDHFALPQDPLAQAARTGRLRRNFQGYTTDAAPVLLGVGASAIGALPGGFAQNEPDERRYLETVAAGRLPIVRGIATSAEDRLRGSLIERLMCDLSLDLHGIPDPVLAPAMERLRILADDGLIELSPQRLAVTAAGRRFVRQVAVCFDAYHAEGGRRHSAAV